MPHVLYHSAQRHRRFSELASAIIESHAVPARVVERTTFRTLSDAMGDDSDPQPDLLVAGIWVATTSTTSTTNLPSFLDSARRDARVAGSTEPVAVITYREHNDRADAIAAMTVDDLARLLARLAEAEAVLAS